MKTVLDINSPVNEFYWHEEIYESQALKVAVCLSLSPKKTSHIGGSQKA
jgi:hypothetical protein